MNLSDDPILMDPPRRSRQSRKRALDASLPMRPPVLAPAALPPPRKREKAANGNTVSDESNGRRRDGQVQLSTIELQTEACRLRAAGVAYAVIAQQLDISTGRAHQLVTDAKRARMVEAGAIAVEAELAHYEEIRRRCYELLDRKQYQVSAGNVVRDTVDGPDGQPLIDPRTGQPLMVRLEDTGAVLAIMDRLIKVGEAVARLHGLNAPKKTESTVKHTGTVNALAGFTREDLAALVAEGVRSLRAPAADIIDVQAREVTQ